MPTRKTHEGKENRALGRGPEREAEERESESIQSHPRGAGQAIEKLWTTRIVGPSNGDAMKKDRAESHRTTTLAELDSVIDFALLIAGH